MAVGTAPLLYTSVRLYDAATGEHDGCDSDAEDGDDRAPALRTWRTYEVARPTELYCGCHCLVSIVAFFLYPLAYKLTAGMPRSAALFVAAGTLSGARLYLDAGALVRECGTLDVVAGAAEGAGARLARARAAALVGGTARNGAWLRFWILVYAGLAALFVAVTLNISKVRVTAWSKLHLHENSPHARMFTRPGCSPRPTPRIKSTG